MISTNMKRSYQSIFVLRLLFKYLTLVFHSTQTRELSQLLSPLEGRFFEDVLTLKG